MRIARLELNNIGVFEHQEIEFRQKKQLDRAEIHILTGVNGSGKSTVLYALASAFRFVEALRIRYRSTDNQSYVKVELEDIGTITIHHNSEWRNNPLPLKIYHEQLEQPDLPRKPLDFAVFAYSDSRSLSSVGIRSIQESSTNPLKNTLNFQNSVDSQLLLQWIANTKAKIAFAQQDQNEQMVERYKSSIERIEYAIQEIIDLPVRFTFRYDPIAVGIEINHQELTFDTLADGLKSIISWIADLLMRLDSLYWAEQGEILDRNFILFLDEIEIHLHPAWQRKILPVVQKLFKNAQIFIATHSPFVVASISDAWVYKFAVKDGKSSLVAVEESMAGSSYPTVLDEIFGIAEYFDVETEKEFAQFYAVKESFLRRNGTTLPELLTIANRLAERGPEVKEIIGRELRQLERITGQPVAI